MTYSIKQRTVFDVIDDDLAAQAPAGADISYGAVTTCRTEDDASKCVDAYTALATASQAP